MLEKQISVFDRLRQFKLFISSSEQLQKTKHF